MNTSNRLLANVVAQVEIQNVEGALSLTSKGKPCLIVNGYEYKRDKLIESGAVQRWRCVKCSCNGTAKTDYGSVQNLRLINTHVCRASPNAFIRRDVIAKIKTAAVTSFGSSSTAIVTSGKSGITDNQLLCLPTSKALQDIVQRKKKPVGASSVDKPLGQIKWLDYFTQTEDGRQFLLHDSRSTEPGLPPIFIFLSPVGLRLLKENTRWSMDGTFFCAPKNFVQLYTVNVFKGETTLPCMYALLKDKSTETYIRMFGFLRRLDLQPQSVMIDFETAAVNALEEVFEHFDVDFCQFHLSKNAFANIQNLKEESSSLKAILCAILEIKPDGLALKVDPYMKRVIGCEADVKDAMDGEGYLQLAVNEGNYQMGARTSG